MAPPRTSSSAHSPPKKSPLLSLRRFASCPTSSRKAPDESAALLHYRAYRARRGMDAPSFPLAGRARRPDPRLCPRAAHWAVCPAALPCSLRRAGPDGHPPPHHLRPHRRCGTQRRQHLPHLHPPQHLCHWSRHRHPARASPVPYRRGARPLHAYRARRLVGRSSSSLPPSRHRPHHPPPHHLRRASIPTPRPPPLLPSTYAPARALLEEHRSALPAIPPGANGGILTMRIKRLPGSKESVAPRNSSLSPSSASSLPLLASASPPPPVLRTTSFSSRNTKRLSSP